jgi:hypothetical protein
VRARVLLVLCGVLLLPVMWPLMWLVAERQREGVYRSAAFVQMRFKPE